MPSAPLSLWVASEEPDEGEDEYFLEKGICIGSMVNSSS